MDELIRELKSQGVLKSHLVEAAFRAIDRKDFVPAGSVNEAYGNYPLVIGEGQTISQPYTVAFMLDLLDPQPGEKILDIGAGSGWQTALLAHIVSQESGSQKSPPKADPPPAEKVKSQKCGEVIAMERIPGLCRLAIANVEKYNFVKSGVVELLCRDASDGLGEKAPFDKIIAAAAAEGKIPEAWKRQLKIGGRIVAPVDDAICLYIRKSAEQWQEEKYPGFAFVPLISGEAKKAEDERGRAYKLKRGLFILYILFSFFFLYSAYATFTAISIGSPGVQVEIPKGSGSRVIGELLKSKGIVRSKWSFVAYATLSGEASSLKPGLYQFEGRIGIADILGQLVRGERYPNERFITIPEGWSLRDMGEYFEKSGIARASEWWKTTGRPAADYRNADKLAAIGEFEHQFEFLASKPKNASLEGFLFPDTYRIYRDAPLGDVAKKMLENFDKKLAPDLRGEIVRGKRSIFEIITMASLIEKEIPDHEERKIAAGILWKRLELGIPLQVDATINYITGKSGSPTGSDFDINSPYNTYRRAGLPIGPISNPGEDAIRAAVLPKTGPYLYYLSTPSGKTIFSRTLEEHNIAKVKYLKRGGSD